ncbi:unnamed protein product [Lota lota]
MRLNFTTSWIFQGWITYFVLALYAQKTFAKTIQCGLNQYLTKGSKCCDLCGPGFRLNIECSGSKQTKCLKCNHGEYQPGWTQEKRCLQQSTCDSGKGFMQRPENPLAEVPCKCRPSLQCSLINCEYCESLPTCSPGYGLEPDLESPTGRRVCVPCKRGFFSNEKSQEPCKQWTSCKSLGRSELQPASTQNDAVCGPLVTGATTSWVIVSVLSIITVLSLLILSLFCYKDKLKLLSVNLRSCIQNLKRTRIQQETPLYHSGARTMGAGAAEVGPGEPNYIVCETTKLICQAPHSLPPEPLYPRAIHTPCDDTKVSMLCTALTEVSEQEREQEVMSLRRKLGAEEGSERSGEPEEVSDDEGGEEEKGKKEKEEEEKEEVEEGDGPSLLVGSCVCLAPAREPLEVGENEDCSQAVSHGALSACSCGGGQGRGRDEGPRWREGVSEVTSRGRVDGGGSENIENSGLSLIHTTTPTQRVPSSPLRELCLPHTQTQTKTRPELNFHPSERPQVQSLETNRLTSTDSDSAKTSVPSTAFIPSSSLQPVPILMSPLPAGDLYLGTTHEASNTEWSQGVSWGHSGGNKLLSGGLELECPPESLQSQLAEPAPTSGQVTGNHNTTFISSGQVMNFSGDVIVVYVSQSSAGDEDPGTAFGSPVQEQANDSLRSCQPQHHVTPGDSIAQNACQASTLPVQEVMADWPRGKSLVFPRWSSDVRLDGKMAIVTGANTGIGKETAKDLARRGARVVLACRDMAKGEQAVQDILKEVAGAKVVARQLDLSDIKSICQFAENIYNTEKALHFLINNAGVAICPYSTTVDGYEMQFGVNHLGHFFLTFLLLDLLKHSAPSRVINVSSAAHTMGRIHFEDLASLKDYHPVKAYAQSKLANVLFTREMAKRTEVMGVTVYAVDPGMVNTEVLRHVGRPLQEMAKRFNCLLKNTAEGALTTMYCVVTPGQDLATGGYYCNCKQAECSRAGQDDGTALKLWAMSCHLLGIRWR